MVPHLFRSVHRHPTEAAQAAQPTDHDADTIALYRWLTGEAASRCLAELAERHEPLVKATTRLRKSLSAAETHLVLEQSALRRKGVEKFARAGEMFFTPLGLEQATDEVVAGYKAGRFAPGEPVADLCCGIGGDFMSLAGRGPVVGVDRDPIKVLLAAANGRVVHSTATPRGELMDVGEFDLTQVGSWHLDPDRRPQGKRTTRVDDHEPNTEMIDRLLGINEQGAIKLAPAAVLPERWTHDAELEWISRGGECRQLVAWFGGLTSSAGTVRATKVDTTNGIATSFAGIPNVGLPVAVKVGSYIYEPDAAVLAARLEGALAETHGLSTLSGGIAYLTGDSLVGEPLMSCFEVQAVLPFQAKRLRALLRSRGIGRLEVKKRGVPYDPEELRRQLHVPGDETGTLIVTRVHDAVTAIVGRRVVPDNGAAG